MRVAERDLATAQREANAATSRYNLLSGEATPLPFPRASTGDTLDAAGPPNISEYAGEAPATSLLDEEIGDGQANCLEQAAAWLDRTTPDFQRNAQLVFLRDKDGSAGHVVVSQNGRITDPADPSISYDNIGAYTTAHSQYEELSSPDGGRISAANAERILATEPGSDARRTALRDANVSDELQQLMVADPPANPQADADANALYEATLGGGGPFGIGAGWGTDEEAIWRTLEGKSGAEIEDIRQSFHRLHGQDLDTVLKDDLRDGPEDLARVEGVLRTAAPERLRRLEALHQGSYSLGGMDAAPKMNGLGGRFVPGTETGDSAETEAETRARAEAIARARAMAEARAGASGTGATSSAATALSNPASQPARPYQLSYMGSPSDENGTYDIYRMTVEGRQIDITLDAGSLAPGEFQHTPDQVAGAIAALPPELFSLVKGVDLHTKRSPDDAFWAAEYENPDHRAYMGAGADGQIQIYPTAGPYPSHLIRDSLMHETGHVWSNRAFGDDNNAPTWDAYRQAAAHDGVPVSDYGEESIGEDISEFTAAYFAARDGPFPFESFRAKFPNRVAFIEERLRMNNGTL